MKDLAGFILFLLFSITAHALELKREVITTDGRPRPVFTCFSNGQKIKIPDHGIAIEAHHNKEKSLWAINVHEVSNINNVDLVISAPGMGNKVLIVEGIDAKIEPFLIKQGVLPNRNWEENYLWVKSVHHSILCCILRTVATNRFTKAVCKFKINVVVKDDSVFFSFVK